MNRTSGICAVATLLLFFSLVLSVTEGQNPPTASFTTDPAPPKATQPFNVILTVQISPSTFESVYGHFSVLDPGGSPVPGWSNVLWSIDFDGSTEKSYTFLGVVVPSSGFYTLLTDVHWAYWYANDWKWTVTPDQEQTIYVEPFAPPAEQYSIEWLKPISLYKPFKAGSTIKIKFSVIDSSGDFKRDETVKVAVTDSGGKEVFTAVYGEGANPVRIKDSTECYIAYWKTEKGMSGPYTITVTFTNAIASNAQVTLTIRP